MRRSYPTGSTEWGELEADRLKAGALAYLNVDSSSSGNCYCCAVPALAGFRDVARRLIHAWFDRCLVSPVQNLERAGLLQFGSGSDYTVFLNFLEAGRHLTFDGPWCLSPVYDSFNWVDRVAIPATATMRRWRVTGRCWFRTRGVRFVPLDYAAYAQEVGKYMMRRNSLRAN